MFSSRRHPKYLTTEYCLILFSFLVMSRAGYCFFPFWNKKHLVLSYPKCITGLLSIKHTQRLLKSIFRCFSIKLTFSLLKIRQISSAYSLKSQSFTADFILFPYNNKKRKDPKWTLEGLHNFKHLVLRGFCQGLR